MYQRVPAGIPVRMAPRINFKGIESLARATIAHNYHVNGKLFLIVNYKPASRTHRSCTEISDKIAIAIVPSVGKFAVGFAFLGAAQFSPVFSASFPPWEISCAFEIRVSSA